MIFKIASIKEFSEYIIQNKPELIKDAREWAKDCTWSETEEDPENSFIDEIEPSRLLKLINRHYDGGLRSFHNDFSFMRKGV
jgi:hypothetical protein